MEKISFEKTVAEISSCDWMSYWAGNWCLLSCSYFGHQYTWKLKEVLGVGLTKTVIVSRGSYSKAFLDKADRLAFGNGLSKKVSQDKRFATGLANDLKREAKQILAAIKKLSGKDAIENNYDDFLGFFYSYVSPHVGLKNIVDYMPANLLDELLPVLSEARVFCRACLH